VLSYSPGHIELGEILCAYDERTSSEGTTEGDQGRRIMIRASESAIDAPNGSAFVPKQARRDGYVPRFDKVLWTPG
jgi:hypothetical protein